MKSVDSYQTMPVLACRRSFFPTRGTIAVLGYGGARIDAYRNARDAFFAGGPTAMAVETRRGIGAPVRVVVWYEDLRLFPELERRFHEFPEWFELVFRNAAAIAYAVRRE
jgi:hypothetical protein